MKGRGLELCIYNFIKDKKGGVLAMADRFEGVTVLKKANVYYEGKVTSRTVLFPDGTKKTLGIMLPGVYEFNTADKEIMEVTSGVVRVKIEGKDDWKTYKEGDTFEIPANSKFEIKVDELFDYVCSYVKE